MNYYFILALLLFGYMNFWFLLSLKLKRNDIADFAWGLGFVFLSWSAFFLSKKALIEPVLVNLLITVWGGRLAWHIGRRLRKKAEDSRYQEWRKQWGNSFYLRSYFQVYLLQGLFLYLIAFPVLFINHQLSYSFNLVFLLGIVVWLIGFFFEAVGDWQLAKFISNPNNKGKIMQSGLWQFTRHPNYFGEVTLWWGIYLTAVSVNNGWLTIFGPLTITILILFVSGIPLLEKKYAGRPDFEDYKKRTSVFFPLPSRK